VALDEVDLSSDGSDSGSPAGVVTAAAVVAGLAGVALWRRRRARAASGGEA
jgi:MYXO-CTERM domain-containing protein